MTALLNRITDQVNPIWIEGVLSTSSGVIKRCSRDMPGFDVSLKFDAVNQRIVFEELQFSEDWGDSSTIPSSYQEGHHISVEQLRTFQHDYTFWILSEETDRKLSSVFSPLDSNDDMTPDVIVSRDGLLAFYEFGTTMNSNRLQGPHDIKIEKYKSVINDRLRNDSKEVKCFLAAIIVSTTAICYSDLLDLDEFTINELIHRYRFATRVVDEAKRQGVQLAESPREQELINLKLTLTSIEPEFTDDGLPGAVTKGSIITDDISTEAALNYSKLLYHKCFLEGVRHMGKQDVPDRGQITDYIDSIIGGRVDQKSIIQLPGNLPSPFEIREAWLPLTSENPVLSLWSTVLCKVKNDEVDLAEYDEEDLLRVALSKDSPEENDVYHSLKSKYHRINIDLDETQRTEFAKLGVNAKHHLDEPEVQDYRLSKKEGFSYNCATDDVDDFLESDFNINRSARSNASYSIINLLKTSQDIYPSSPSSQLRTITKLTSLPFHNLMEMYTDIGVELSISLKQNVKGNDFILKKLRSYDIWLLIKPTSSDKHIFVSFFWKAGEQIIPPGVSKRHHSYGDYCFTDFVSFNISKLVNIVKAQSTFLSMVFQWCRYYDEVKWDDLEAIDPNVWKMLKLCMMIHLEDKHQTEEVFTLFRYISMEKYSLVSQDPFKMIEKFPTVIRSRLALWAIRKLIMEMGRGPYFFRKNDGREQWENLWNPYLNVQERDPSKLVELYYIGYAKNKDEISSPNTDFELVKKIIKYEMALYEADTRLLGTGDPVIQIPEAQITDDLKSLVDASCLRSGNGDLHKLKFHEFSRRANCAAADNLRMFWRKEFGRDFDNKITDMILRRMVSISWDKVATLKASSTFDPKEAPEGKVRTTRMRVIIAVLQNEGLIGKKPVDSIVNILNWVDSDGGLRVDLFKKNQHGGLREIYVLELHSRILQLFLEEISRAICDTIPMEMMMHASEKLRRPQEHIIRSARRPEKFKTNVCSSNDAKVWNQGHLVTKFIQFLVRALPTEFHGLIINGMKQWLNKRIKLPDGVYNLLFFKPETEFFGKEESTLSDAYRGLVEVPWMKMGANHMNIRSGMMQGILHYTSSAYHASVLMLRDNLFKSYMQKLGIKVLTTDLVSSDDSSRLTDTFSTSEQLAKRGLIFSRADHIAIAKFSTFFGIAMSPKSSIATSHVVEFNSEFYIRASLARPTYKWVVAAIGVIEIESLFERQELMYNLMVELLEGGSGFMQAHGTQLAQAFLHYKLLGAGINKLWATYSHKLTDIADPSLGFFLTDPPVACGLFGLNFSFWSLVLANEHLNCRLQNQIETGNLTSTTKGSLMNGVQIRYGNRARVLKILEDAESYYPGWQDVIESDPQVLYQHPSNKRDVLLRMLVKLTSPSVTASLSAGNAISRMISSSVYVITHKATSLGSAWFKLVENYQELNSKRYSLFQLLAMDVDRKPLTPENFQALFPLSKQYQQADDLIRKVSKFQHTHSNQRKRLRSHIAVFPVQSEVALSLEDVVRRIWFGQVLPVSDRVVRASWAHYKRLFPWLLEDPIDTLKSEDCPFDSQISLRNFVARQGLKSRFVHLTGAPVRTTESHDMILTAICNNQKPHVVLSLEGKSRDQHKIHSFDSMVANLAKILAYPWNNEEKLRRVSNELEFGQNIWDGGVVRPPPRLQRLSVIQDAIRYSRNPSKTLSDGQKIYDKISLMKGGSIGGWLRRQSRTDTGWSGSGVWFGKTGDTIIRLELQGGELLRMTVDDIESAKRDRNLIAKLISDMEVFVKPSSLTFSMSNWFWFGSNFSRERIGCPVFVGKQVFNEASEMPRFVTRVLDSSIRLYLDVGRMLNICSYNYQSEDFRWYATSPGRSADAVWENWSRNASLSPDLAIRVLKAPIYKKTSTKMDMGKLKEFFKNLLRSSVASVGLNPSIHDLLKMPDELDDFEVGISLDDLLDYTDLIVTEDSDVAADDRESSEVVKYDLDMGLGIDELFDFSYNEERSSRPDIFRNHLLFKELCSWWLSDLSRRERKLFIEKKQVFSNREDMKEILNHYLEMNLMIVEDAPQDLSGLEEFEQLFE